MATYLELKEQAEKLMAQAEEMRQQEIDGAIQDIKSKMQLYGLTAQDLGFAGGAGGGAGGKRAIRPKASKGAGEKSPAKYRGPNGETWAGGRGRKPRWVVEALANGKTLEDLAIQ